jgi:hypothetical protein
MAGALRPLCQSAIHTMSLHCELPEGATTQSPHLHALSGGQGGKQTMQPRRLAWLARRFILVIVLYILGMQYAPGEFKRCYSRGRNLMQNLQSCDHTLENQLSSRKITVQMEETSSFWRLSYIHIVANYISNCSVSRPYCQRS